MESQHIEHLNSLVHTAAETRGIEQLPRVPSEGLGMCSAVEHWLRGGVRSDQLLVWCLPCILALGRQGQEDLSWKPARTAGDTLSQRGVLS